MDRIRMEPSWQRDQGTKSVVLTDPLSIIYNEGQWKINKVSPMYNLQYNVVKLKQYSSKIRQGIVSNVTANSSIRYVVKINEEPNLKYKADDANGVTITVESINEGNSKTKLAYMAVLLSWGLSTKLNNTTHLPYLLERGEQKIGAIVKSTLQTIFDCNIKQLCFTQQQVLQIGLNYVENDTSRETEQFVMVFKTPNIDIKDKLSISFDIGDVRIIWNGVKEEVTQPSEQLNLAYQILQNQIYHMVTLDITPFDLCEIILPKAEVKSSGIVKMKTAEIVNSALVILNCISEAHSIKELSDDSMSNRST